MIVQSKLNKYHYDYLEVQKEYFSEYDVEVEALEVDKTHFKKCSLCSITKYKVNFITDNCRACERKLQALKGNKRKSPERRKYFAQYYKDKLDILKLYQDGIDKAAIKNDYDKAYKKRKLFAKREGFKSISQHIDSFRNNRVYIKEFNLFCK